MKKLTFVLVLAIALTVVVAGTVLAAPPTPQTPQQAPQQGYGMMGRGYGMHTPGTGLGQPGTMMGRGGMIGRGMPAWAGFEDEVAKLLDMSQADIQAARQSGKSLAQIADEKNVSKDTLVKAILDAKKADLDAAVAAGTLTEAQADAMYDRMDDMVPFMVDQTGVGPRANQGGCPMFGTPDGDSNGTTAMRRGGRWAQN